MMQMQRWVAVLGTWRLCMLVSLGLAGRTAAQTSSYDALAEELRASAPPGGQAELEDRLELDELAALNRRSLIVAVWARNPSIETARQAWRAALARHPQAKALDDVTVSYSLAPLSIRSDQVSFGQLIELSQRFPGPGKRALQGEIALAQAEARREEYEATRLDLALIASVLFDQYYAVERSLDLNDEHRALLQDIKAIAQAQYEAGRATQQEPLQAELELGHIVHQRVVLESERGVVVARINGLLHRRPHMSLPPPPERIEADLQEPAHSTALQDEALRSRPEIRKSQSQIREGRTAVDLAKREYYPDFGVATSYNSMWQAKEHRWTAGVSLNLPVQVGARRGAVDEAEARLLEEQYELRVVADEVRVEVESARQRLLEAQHVVRLYRGRLLPAARAQIEAARIGYETGRNTFQALIDAERSVRTLDIEYQRALAQLGQRQAELERVVGRVSGVAETGETP